MKAENAEVCNNSTKQRLKIVINDEWFLSLLLLAVSRTIDKIVT